MQSAFRNCNRTAVNITLRSRGLSGREEASPQEAELVAAADASRFLMQGLFNPQLLRAEALHIMETAVATHRDEPPLDRITLFRGFGAITLFCRRFPSSTGLSFDSAKALSLTVGAFGILGLLLGLAQFLRDGGYFPWLGLGAGLLLSSTCLLTAVARAKRSDPPMATNRQVAR